MLTICILVCVFPIYISPCMYIFPMNMSRREYVSLCVCLCICVFVSKYILLYICLSYYISSVCMSLPYICLISMCGYAWVCLLYICCLRLHVSRMCISFLCVFLHMSMFVYVCVSPYVYPSICTFRLYIYPPRIYIPPMFMFPLYIYSSIYVLFVPHICMFSHIYVRPCVCPSICIIFVYMSPLYVCLPRVYFSLYMSICMYMPPI